MSFYVNFIRTFPLHSPPHVLCGIYSQEKEKPMPEPTTVRTVQNPLCGVNNKEPIPMIKGSSVDPIFSGYYFTPGAKAMLDEYIVGRRASYQTCFFNWCWNYKSPDLAKEKLLLFMKMVMGDCGKSNNKHREEDVISTDATALAVDMLLSVSGELLFSADDADNAMDLLLSLKNLKGERAQHDDPFYGRCYSMTSIGPGCFKYLHEGVSICMNDCDTERALARRLNSQYVEITPLDE